MKIENFIVQYLYEAKKVTLEQIGSFFLQTDIAAGAEPDKETPLPPDAIRFEFDRNATQDDGLINYIVSQTRKIKPLASSDLESYSILARQFLNIGKPLVIEGLGTLLKNQEGNYVFTQGAYVNTKIDLNGQAPLREKASEEISFSTPEKKKSQRVNPWLFVALFSVLAAAGAVAYYFFTKENTEKPLVETPVVSTDTATKTAPLPDSLKQATLAPDSTLMKRADSASLTRHDTSATADNYNFKVVIKEYPNKLMAEKAFNRLSGYGHKLLLLPIDSVKYKLAIPFNTPVSDTLRAKDSLRIFFNSRTYVEL